MKLSIISPVYKVEPLPGSLPVQSDKEIPIEEYEIIVVNDGSPDDSRNIIIKPHKETNNIKLIDQENQETKNNL